MQEVVYQTPGHPTLMCASRQLSRLFSSLIVLSIVPLDSIRHVAARPQKGARLHKKFAQITELYEDSPEGLMKQNKSRRDHGMTS